MIDLTEQWQKGELPEGAYYIRIGDKIVIDETVCTGDFYLHTDCDEVIAKVPTYEEYQALLSDQLAKNEGVEINAELKAKLKEWKKLAYDAKPIIMAHQNNAKTLAQKLLQVKPELREWLEVNYKEYL